MVTAAEGFLNKVNMTAMEGGLRSAKREKRPVDTDGHLATRERILRAAADLFSRQGFAGTSTREIADDVGIAQPGLYRHFKSKDDILVALGTEILAPWVHVCEREAKSNTLPPVKLARLFRGICYEILTSPYSAAFLLAEPAIGDSKFISLHKLYRRATKTIETTISSGIKSGVFRSVHPGITQQSIMSLTDVLIFPTPGKPSVKIDHIIELTIRGLLTDPSKADDVVANAYYTLKR